MKLAIRTKRNFYAQSGDLILLEDDISDGEIHISVIDHTEPSKITSAKIDRERAQEIITFLTNSIK